MKKKKKMPIFNFHYRLLEKKNYTFNSLNQTMYTFISITPRIKPGSTIVKISSPLITIRTLNVVTFSVFG